MDIDIFSSKEKGRSNKMSVEDNNSCQIKSFNSSDYQFCQNNMLDEMSMNPQKTVTQSNGSNASRESTQANNTYLKWNSDGITNSQQKKEIFRNVPDPKREQQKRHYCLWRFQEKKKRICINCQNQPCKVDTCNLSCVKFNEAQRQIQNEQKIIPLQNIGIYLSVAVEKQEKKKLSMIRKKQIHCQCKSQHCRLDSNQGCLCRRKGLQCTNRCNCSIKCQNHIRQDMIDINSQDSSNMESEESSSICSVPSQIRFIQFNSNV